MFIYLSGGYAMPVVQVPLDTSVCTHRSTILLRVKDLLQLFSRKVLFCAPGGSFRAQDCKKGRSIRLLRAPRGCRSTALRMSTDQCHESERREKDCEKAFIRCAPPAGRRVRAASLLPPCSPIVSNPDSTKGMTSRPRENLFGAEAPPSGCF